MYPHPIIFGLGLYDLLLALGIIACFFTFAFLADKLKIKRKIQNFALLCGVFATVLGYGSAVLFQAFYNIKSRGGFEINKNTGATFYGGLIGGALVFLILYFGLGRLKFVEGEHKDSFFMIADCAVPGITLAHAIGRVGCFFAGCCHGGMSSAWYAVYMYGGNGFGKYVPVQLFEAFFLIVLTAFLLLRMSEKHSLNLPIYLVSYGVWRFFAEYLRADYRGDIFTDLLTPSQLIACIMVAVGIGVAFIQIYVEKRITETANLNAEDIDPIQDPSVQSEDVSEVNMDDETSD